MIISRIKAACLKGTLAVGASLFVCSLVFAQPVNDNREASFLPPPDMASHDSSVPPLDDVLKNAKPPTSAAQTPTPAPQSQTPAVQPSTPAPLSPAPASQPPTQASQPPTTSPPVDLGSPVATATLPAVDPDAIGLLSNTTGGLGDSLWNDTPRALVDRLLPQMGVPTGSPALNSLARRLLLTVAALPPGKSDAKQSLTALRLEKVLALGDGAEAWQLAKLAKPGLVDDITQLLVTEAALVGPDGKTVCEKMPEIMAGHKESEWQKALIVCQLREGNTKAAQLGLDLLHEQQVNDDIFFTLINHNIIENSKNLPRQLTPLRVLNLALLRQIDRPLPAELYARPEALLIPELLQASAAVESARLSLAERAATRGLISAAQLAEAYRRVTFGQEILAGAINSNENGPFLHALLYQAASQEEALPKRAELIGKFVQTTDATALNGALGQVLAELIAPLSATKDYTAFAPTAARVLALADKPDQALAWLKLARGSASNQPDAAAQLQANWPLFVLAGLVTDTEYGQETKGWLDGMLKAAAETSSEAGKADKDTKDTSRALRQKAGSILLFLGAAGFAVPEEALVRVADVAEGGKRVALPSPVLMERLREAATNNRRGEVVLLSVLLAGGPDAPLLVVAEAVRSLRQVGLTADAQALAREAVTAILAGASTLNESDSRAH
jgi:hypothetical protein